MRRSNLSRLACHCERTLRSNLYNARIIPCSRQIARSASKAVYNPNLTMKIIRSRRKSIAIVVERDGALTVRAPYGVSQALIDEFVQSKSAWIQTTQQKLKRFSPPVHCYENGEEFLFMGKAYPLTLVSGRAPALVFRDGFFLNAAAKAKAPVLFTAWYKSQARKIISERLAALACVHDFHYQKMRLSSARTRWGSCSSRKTISITWRLIMAPPEVIDYVLIHELVHLEFPNHSKTFWKRVAALQPGYPALRKWLKENGAALNL